MSSEQVVPVLAIMHDYLVPSVHAFFRHSSHQLQVQQQLYS